MINTKPSPDQYSTGFIKTAAKSLRYDYMSLDPDDVAMILSSLIKPESKVLDVGCGTGVVTEIIRNQTSAVITGIEPDEDRVRLAAERGLNVYPGYLTSDFIKEHGPYDFIVFADVLEHISNPAEIVIMAKEGLKPGGSILASVPNVAHWFVRMDLLFGYFDYQDCGIMDATHLRWFTRKTIREFFELLGFEITALKYSVNIALPDYYKRIPWRWMPLSFRRRFAGILATLWPGLFGCQFVVRANLPN
jgi:methionine biosynthesis protein MetW